MGYIRFARNQTNMSGELLVPAEIVSITSSGATNLVIQTQIHTQASYLLQWTLQLGATGGATLTRANIVQKVQDAINQAEINGGHAYSTVADMEVELVGVAEATIIAAP